MNSSRTIATGFGAVAAFLVVRLIQSDGPGGFVLAGSPSSTSAAPRELHLYDTGYDGQFVYRLALDPFTRAVTAHGITLDQPAYRQQRIATAVLTYCVAHLPGVGTALALIAVNTLAVLIAIVVGVRLATDLGARPWTGLVLAIPAALPISLGRDLTEPVAWVAILLALLAIRRDRWPWAAAALTVAVLARETSLIVIAGFALAAIYRLVRGDRSNSTAKRAWLLVPLVVEVAWQVWLAHVWGGRPPILDGSDNTGTPFLGIVTNFFYSDASDTTGRLLAITYLAERLALVALLASAARVVIARGVDASVATAWTLAALLALTLQRWGDDVSFLRATYEAWGLSIYVLLTSRARWSGGPLIVAGTVTTGVALLYAVRI